MTPDAIGVAISKRLAPPGDGRTAGERGPTASLVNASTHQPTFDTDPAMTIQIEPQHSFRLLKSKRSNFVSTNSQAIGCRDGESIGYLIRDGSGRMVAAVGGFSWAASAELKQMWVDKSHRGRGYARALLNAFVAEARSRNVRRIWLASYDFQAPGMYEKAGFKRMAEFKDWSEGHSNVVLCKTL
jgi:ribosomal protein S18 acetylase RimI-like enzyme